MTNHDVSELMRCRPLNPNGIRLIMTFSVLFASERIRMEKESRAVVDGAASRAFLGRNVVPPGDECKANKIGGRREWWKFNARILGSRNKLNTVLYRSVLLRSVLWLAVAGA